MDMEAAYPEEAPFDAVTSDYLLDITLWEEDTSRTTFTPGERWFYNTRRPDYTIAMRPRKAMRGEVEDEKETLLPALTLFRRGLVVAQDLGGVSCSVPPTKKMVLDYRNYYELRYYLVADSPWLVLHNFMHEWPGIELGKYHACLVAGCYILRDQADLVRVEKDKAAWL